MKRVSLRHETRGKLFRLALGSLVYTHLREGAASRPWFLISLMSTSRRHRFDEVLHCLRYHTHIAFLSPNRVSIILAKNVSVLLMFSCRTHVSSTTSLHVWFSETGCRYLSSVVASNSADTFSSMPSIRLCFRHSHFVVSSLH